METYNITCPDPPAHQWRETMHHHGLAMAATALLRHPSQPPGRALRKAYATLLDTQLPTGEWASMRESPAPALWPTWHCLSALFDLRQAALLRPGDTLVWLDNAVAVRRASAGSMSLRALVTPPRGQQIKPFIRRRWARILLTAAIALALILVAVGAQSWPNALLALILPVLLLIAQEAIAGIRHPSDATHSTSRAP